MALALGHPEWVLGFQDEVWWSRLAQPNLHTWTAAKPLRLIQNEPDRHDPEPKALACDGLLRADTQGMLLRFVNGRPVSAVTTQFLEWLTERLAAEGKTALLMVWTMPRGTSATPCGRGSRRTTIASSGTAAVA